MTGRYLVAIASYRRPAALGKLLDSLEAAIGSADVDVVVVDNDAAGSARQVATEHPVGPVYVVEPEPGIAAARNRALRQFTDEYAAVIFVDDDEWVDGAWFTTLTTYAEAVAADVVQGPVVTVFPATTPAWITRGGFLQRAIPATGQRLDAAATNNTLLRRDAWLRAGSPTFDEAFSATGGSDHDFFWGLRKAGASLVFCAEAVVYEDVPAERVTLAWVRRRAIRNGIAQTRVRRKHHDLTARWLARSLVLLLRGAVVTACSVAAGRGVQAKSFNELFRNFGRLVALVNYRILEYARPSTSGGGGATGAGLGAGARAMRR